MPPFTCCWTWKTCLTPPYVRIIIYIHIYTEKIVAVTFSRRGGIVPYVYHVPNEIQRVASRQYTLLYVIRPSVCVVHINAFGVPCSAHIQHTHSTHIYHTLSTHSCPTHHTSCPTHHTLHTHITHISSHSHHTHHTTYCMH